MVVVSEVAWILYFGQDPNAVTGGVKNPLDFANFIDGWYTRESNYLLGLGGRGWVEQGQGHV